MKYLITIGGLMNYSNMLLAFRNECIKGLQSSGKPPDRIIMPADEKEKIKTALKNAENRLTLLNNFIVTRAVEVSEAEAKSLFSKDLEELKKRGQPKGKNRILLG